MGLVFVSADEILQVDYLEKGQTINGKYYATLLQQLRVAITTNHREKIARGVLFHQDNAPAYKAAVSMATIHQCGLEIIDHPPYSQDLTPSDFHLFPDLKKHLAGQLFSVDNDVMEEI